MAYALRTLGKQVDVVNSDSAPAPLMQFPGVPEITIAAGVAGPYDAAIIMECGDLARTGVDGLNQSFVINIDHHPGNTAYGQINWFDATAAACGELVFDLVRALGVPLSLEIATHIYLAILTDPGSFHYSSISPPLAASPLSTSITRSRARPAGPTTTPKGSSICRSPSRRFRRWCSSSR